MASHKRTETLPEKAGDRAVAVAKNMTGITIDQEDLILPKIILMQGLSKWVQEQKAKAGDFVNSLTGQVVTNMSFAPAAVTKHYLGLRYEGTKAVVEFRTTDRNDDRLKNRSFFNDKVNKTKATALNVITVIGIFEGKPLAVSFSKTSYKAGKKLLNLIMHWNRPLYEGKYRIVASKETNSEGTFYVMDVEPQGESSQADREAALLFRDSFLPHVEKAMESDKAKTEETEEVPF